MIVRGEVKKMRSSSDGEEEKRGLVFPRHFYSPLKDEGDMW
jgi:hypothetical protein